MDPQHALRDPQPDEARSRPEQPLAAGGARAAQLVQLQRLCGNQAVTRLIADGRLLQRQPEGGTPFGPAASNAAAERELDAKWNVDTSAIDPALANQLLAMPAIQLTIFEAYQTGSDNDTEFPRAAGEFAKTYQTVGLRAAGKGSAVGIGIPITISDRGDLSQVINTVHRTVHRLAEGKAQPAPQIGTIAIFAHGIRKGIGLDPEGEAGHNWMGIKQIKDFVAAIRGALTDNASFLLFACSAGASENETTGPGKGAPAADSAGGEGSFAQVLAQELGGQATVFAHNIKGHVASNPYARVFTADSATGKEMFNVLYDAAFIASERQRMRSDHAAVVEKVADDKLDERLRAAMWSHFDDAVSTDYNRIKTKSRHFSAGGYGGIGAAMFMDPKGTAQLLHDDFRSFWMNDARVKGLGG